MAPYVVASVSLTSGKGQSRLHSHKISNTEAERCLPVVRNHRRLIMPKREVSKGGLGVGSSEPHLNTKPYEYLSYQ